ncbi:MAG TPA: M23 family metallopeptidase [Coleofasciculaceae cyanobacterium]|jgi:murein DD-endopeptidase MepM/ murein hydrolase activator NlpD
MIRDKIRNRRAAGTILTAVFTLLGLTGNLALANIIQPEAPIAQASAIEDTREILNRASLIAFQGVSAVQKMQVLSADSETSELLKNYMASMVYIPQGMALPADSDILDEPWLATNSGTINEEGLVIPHLDDDPTGIPIDGKGAALNDKVLHLLKPVQNALVSSPFGWRWGRPHQGIDLAAPTGTPILAAEHGKVVYSGWKSGYGNFVAIDHGRGYLTHYAHCSRVLVRNGQAVGKGQIIAKVGNTGHSTGPHLHFELVAHGVHRNPAKFLNRSVALVQAD